MRPTEITQYTNNRLQQYANAIKETTAKQLKGSSLTTITNTINALVSEIESVQTAIDFRIIQEYGKIRASEYNALMDNIKIDLQTIYAELDVLIDIYNEVSTAISNTNQEMTNSINAAFTKVRSLSRLFNNTLSIDRIDFETFSTNSNMYSDKNALVIPEKAGLLRLPTDNYTEIYAEENDAELLVSVPNNMAVLDSTLGNPASNKREDGIHLKLFSQENQTIEFDVGSETIEYNGVVLGVVLRLPAIRSINNVYFRPSGGHELDVLGVFYSQSTPPQITDLSWIKIDTEYDTANYDSYEFNFVPVSAASVLILLGQSHFSTEDVRLPKTNMPTTKYLVDNAGLDNALDANLRKYRAAMQEIVNATNRITTEDELNQQLIDAGLENVYGRVSENIKRLIVGVNDFLTDNNTKYMSISGNVYTLGVYDISIKLNDYALDGEYYSDNLTYNRNINAIQLASRYNIPVDSNNKEIGTILYEIETDNGIIPLLPVPEDLSLDISTRDVFVVIDKTARKYDLRFRADISGSNTIVVYINNNILDQSYYTVVSISDSLAKGIQIDSSYLLNTNDIISIEYIATKLDKYQKTNVPYIADIAKSLEYPHIIDKHLYECEADSVCVKKKAPYSGYSKYKIGDNIFKMRNADTISESAVEDHWFVKNTDVVVGADGIAIDPLDYYDSDGADYYLNSSGYRFTGSGIVPSTSYAYHGVIGEPAIYQIPGTVTQNDIDIAFAVSNTSLTENRYALYYVLENESSELDSAYAPIEASGYRSPYTNVHPTTWHTQTEYLPGTLSVKIDGEEAWFQEYIDDSIGYNVEDRTIFYLLENVIPTDSIVCSYVPLESSNFSDTINPNYTSNIKDHNVVESHEGTTEDATILLKSVPFIDNHIVNDSTETDKRWLYKDGRFILLENTDVVYEPIKIILNGHTLDNKTDYINGSTPTLEVYDRNLNNIQYYHKDNKIYFNKSLDERLDIRYYELCGRYKLHISMYRHRKTENLRTPELYDYAMLIDLE